MRLSTKTSGSAAKPVARRLSDVLGAEILGVDIGSPGIAAAMDVIEQALLDHHLLVFPDQHIADDDIASFARRFGEVSDQIFRQADGKPLSPVHSISNLDASGKPSKNPYLVANYQWHTDHAFRARPSSMTFLYGLEIPPVGGDTEWADMTKAYDALPETARRRIDGLRVEHSYEYIRRTVTDRPASEDEQRDAPPVTHPLVRTHAQTGRRSLYLGMYCSRIIGLPDDEGRELLDELLAHATRPQFVYRHVWRKHDLVMWDNRCLLHRANTNFDAARFPRALQRTCLRELAAA